MLQGRAKPALQSQRGKYAKTLWQKNRFWTKLCKAVFSTKYATADMSDQETVCGNLSGSYEQRRGIGSFLKKTSYAPAFLYPFLSFKRSDLKLWNAKPLYMIVMSH